MSRAELSQTDRTRERLIEVYRRKARHYDLTSRLYPVPGYPQQAQRRRAVRALDLRLNDTVVDIACGTGLNFPLLERAVGPGGRIVGVDLTDAMLERAQRRVDASGWGNVTLVRADAADFRFPTDVDAILSTYALTQVPGRELVVFHAAAALADGGRMVVLDLKIPDGVPRRLTRAGVAMAWTSGALDEWVDHRPWQEIRSATQVSFADASWTELCFGTAFLSVGDTAHPTRSGR